MSRTAEQRYGDIAVIFHWLIALFIIGLLVIGKFMTHFFDENDPIRFQLTQWHKSFGLTVLLLSVLRLMWRLTHRPPAELASIPVWQQRIAGFVHLLLYGLMLALPITGWIMSSASPLNIDTVLFNLITVPHIPPFPDLPNKADIAASFHEYHELAGNLLILLLLAHIGAALKHHLIDKDAVLVRMLPNWASESFKNAVGGLTLAIMGAVLGVFLYKSTEQEAALLAAGDSEVSFMADVTGDQTPGMFSDTTVTASIDTQNPANSSIIAVVNTASLSSNNSQVEGSLPDAEWFDVQGHPQARFESTDISENTDGSLQVSGNLTIKTTTESVSFPMTLTDEEGIQVARGEFAIDRRQYDIGLESQETDEYVGFEVIVRFRFDIGERAEGD